VQGNADAPAHADDHRLAGQGLLAGFEVFDQIPGDLGQAVGCADQPFHLGPTGDETLSLLDFFGFGELFNLLVEAGPLLFGQFELNEPVFVIDGDGRTVFDGAFDVIDADVVAEDRAGVAVFCFDGGCR